MKLLTIVGARPQFIKAATISRKLLDSEYQGIREVLVHTGQHYDQEMSGSFFEELDIPPPAYNLEVGSGGHGVQTGAIMSRLEPIVELERPDWMLVYGDTNSTLAAALVAAKMPVRLAHVEAGLRSFRRGMPEEVNRIVTDRLSDLLFCPTDGACRNLLAEGRNKGVHHVGDVMFDSFLYYKAKLDFHAVLRRNGLEERNYILATVHRAENTCEKSRLGSLLQGLGRAGKHIPVIMPMHPRTRRTIEETGLAIPTSIRVTRPLPYLEMLTLTAGASVVATDSGGLQKEAFFACVPCVTLRDETEWIETLEYGWNRLVHDGSDNIATAIEAAASLSPETPHPDYYGDGISSVRTLNILREALS